MKYVIRKVIVVINDIFKLFGEKAADILFEIITDGMLMC